VPGRGDVALVDDEVAVLQEVPEAEVQTVELPRAPWGPGGGETPGRRANLGHMQPRLEKSNKKSEILEDPFCVDRRSSIVDPPTFRTKTRHD